MGHPFRKLAYYSLNLTSKKKLISNENPTPLEYEATIRDKSIETFLQIKRFRTEIRTIDDKRNTFFVNRHSRPRPTPDVETGYKVATT